MISLGYVQNAAHAPGLGLWHAVLLDRIPSATVPL